MIEQQRRNYLLSKKISDLNKELRIIKRRMRNTLKEKDLQKVQVRALQAKLKHENKKLDFFLKKIPIGQDQMTERIEKGFTQLKSELRNEKEKGQTIKDLEEKCFKLESEIKSKKIMIRELEAVGKKKNHPINQKRSDLLILMMLSLILALNIVFGLIWVQNPYLGQSTTAVVENQSLIKNTQNQQQGPKPGKIRAKNQTYLQNQQKLKNLKEPSLDQEENYPTKQKETKEFLSYSPKTKDSTKTVNATIQLKSKSDKFKLNLTRIATHKHAPFQGGRSNWTLLAMKNQRSYLIATESRKLILVENRQKIYSEFLPKIGESQVTDIIYSRSMNCYFYYLEPAIYKKKIDTTRPSQYLKIPIQGRYGNSLIYSEVHRRLIVRQEKTKFLVINLEDRQIDFDFNLDVYFKQQIIFIFKLFGKNEDKLLTLTKDGRVRIYGINFIQKRVHLLNGSGIELKTSENLFQASFGICENSDYFFVTAETFPSSSSTQSPSNWISRSMLFQFDFSTKKILGPFGSLLFKNEFIGASAAVSCYEGFKDRLIFVALTSQLNNMTLVYEYDMKAKKFKELPERRLEHREQDPICLIRFGEYFYYAGNSGNLMRLELIKE